MASEFRPPPAINRLLEGRFGIEAAQLLAQLPALRRKLPEGSGKVLVLPGFMADDNSTWMIRRFLDSLGYESRGWGLGVNRGRMVDFLPQVIRLLMDSDEVHQIVGWSRGGIVAREVARDRPDLVRSIVTLGSPVRGGPGATSIGRMVKRETGLTPEEMQAFIESRARRPIEVPITAIYSKTDGVVSWEACVDDANPRVTHKEVNASHVGMGANARVFREIAMALHRESSG